MGNRYCIPLTRDEKYLKIFDYIDDAQYICDSGSIENMEKSTNALQQIQQLIDNGFNINYGNMADSDAYSPLMIACMGDPTPDEINIDLLKLLSRYSYIPLNNRWDGSVIDILTRMQRQDIIDIILKERKDRLNILIYIISSYGLGANSDIINYFWNCLLEENKPIEEFNNEDKWNKNIRQIMLQHHGPY